MPQSHTWQGVDRENSLYQESTHAEWFSHSKCSEHLASCWHWWLKAEVFWVRLPVASGLFTFLYFHFITFYFQHEARCSQYENVSCQTNEDTNYLNLLVRTLASH